MRIGEIAGYLGEIAGYLAAVLVFLTFYMKTMIPLRMIGIAAIACSSYTGLSTACIPSWSCI